MLRRPRWRKLARDVVIARGRIALMVVAIAVSLIAVGGVLGAYAILTREIAASYRGTAPAAATLELEDGISPELVAEVRRRPELRDAEAREVVVARVRVGDDWRPLLLFVVDDFADLRLNTFRAVDGAWPPPAGTMLVERGAVAVIGAGTGDRVVVQTPHGDATEVPIRGVVHDPGLAPAWQERMGYAYVTRETAAALGEPELHELRIAVRERPHDAAAIGRTAEAVARWLGERGHPVHQIRIPPPGRHPHQTQMVTILTMLLGFAAMALALSAVLVATSLAAMLARQVREIGVMKTLGARTAQIGGMYVGLVASLGVVATAIAAPAGVLGARGFASAVAAMLNFDLASTAIPPWVFAVQLAAGLVLPLAVAAVPIARASRITVRAALDEHGAGGDRVRRLPLPFAVRNAVRRPVRLALTLGLLATGGAMFMTARDLGRSWDLNLAKLYSTRHYDVEVKLDAPLDDAAIARLRAVTGVRTVEPWGYSPAAFARPGAIDVVRTYPDRGHGSLIVLAPPPATRLISFPLRAGRWLRPGDRDAVVLNHTAAHQAGGARVGDTVRLSLDGKATSWRVVGVVEEIGAAGVAYVTDEAFAAATGEGPRILRITSGVTTASGRAAAIRDIEAELARSGARISTVLPFSELKTAIGEHLGILTSALLALAVIIAIVGGLGLASTMGTSVIERTREIGVMKACGATPGRIARTVVAEGLAIAVASWALAVAVSLPLAVVVDEIVGGVGFLAPLPFAVDHAAVVLWLIAIVAVAVLATSTTAFRAGRLDVRDALARP